MNTEIIQKLIKSANLDDRLIGLTLLRDFRLHDLRKIGAEPSSNDLLDGRWEIYAAQIDSLEMPLFREINHSLFAHIYANSVFFRNFKATQNEYIPL